MTDTDAPPGRLSLSDLVTATGVPASTIHHYRRAGLIPPPDRPVPNRFCYDLRHVESLRLIRQLRERRGLGLEAIAEMLPALLAAPAGADHDDDPPADVRARILEAATEAFRVQSYGEVTVGDVACRAGVAKGRVYRYFDAKEDLFEAVVEGLLTDTAARFAAAVEDLGGPRGVAGDPERTAAVFAELVAGAMPILLELGARAAKGHEPSGNLARRVLRTLAEAAGRPLSPAAAGRPLSPGCARLGDDEGALTLGLGVIERAFATVIAWAVSPEWEIPGTDGPANGS